MALEVEYVTHASLLLRAPEVSLLTDPFYFPERDRILAPSVRLFPPRDLDAAHFGRIDYVFSSHEHDDHCHRATLAALRERIGTVLLPAGRPALVARYRDLGFDDIVLLENRRPVALHGGLEVTCVWDDPVDSMLVAKLEGKSVLHANDCLAAASTFAEIGPVDYAFVCSTSTQDLFPFILPRSARELQALAKAREEAFFADQLRRIAALRPRVVIPYSYTVAYVDPAQLYLNGGFRITPPMFRDRLRDVACWPLQPGDVIADTVRPIRAESLWGADLAGFQRNLVAWARGLTLPRFERGEPEDCEPTLRAHLAGRHGPDVALHVVGERRTATHVVGRGPGIEISIPASLLGSLLAGEYDPFMILYTYRIGFRPDPARPLDPSQEYRAYVDTFVELFSSGTKMTAR